MNLTVDDPRLTAYVLDELDQDGNKFVESEMARCNECRIEARDLTDFTDQLSAALAAEPMPELAPNQQRAIEIRLKQTAFRRQPIWIPIGENWFLKTGLAVLILLALWFVPIPANLSSPLTNFLTKASDNTAQAMLRATGSNLVLTRQVVFVIRSGPKAVGIQPTTNLTVYPATNFAASGGFRPVTSRVLIDFECNPLCWMTILLGAGLLAGSLYLRSPGGRLTLVAIAIPLLVLSDALRKFVLAEWLVQMGGRTPVSPPFNLTQPVFVVFSLFALILILILLRRLERKVKRKA